MEHCNLLISQILKLEEQEVPISPGHLVPPPGNHLGFFFFFFFTILV